MQTAASTVVEALPGVPEPGDVRDEMVQGRPAGNFIPGCHGPVRAFVAFVVGKGWWCKAGSPAAHHAMSTAWLDRLGLVTLTVRDAELQTP